MTTALVVAAECVLLIAAGIAIAEVLTTWWFEKRFLPRIAGED